MKFRFRVSLAAAAVGLLVSAAAYALPNTNVLYKLYHFEGGTWVRYRQTDAFPAGGATPGTNLWKYEYTVKNLGYAGTGINTWYAFFDSDNVLCSTHSSATGPGTWATTKQGPVAPNNNWKERFRTVNSGEYITQGNQLSGFSVTFTLTCPVLPGNQSYDAVTSGGSEASVTSEDPENPVPVENATWSGIKSLYR